MPNRGLFLNIRLAFHFSFHGWLAKRTSAMGWGPWGERMRASRRGDIASRLAAYQPYDTLPTGKGPASCLGHSGAATLRAFWAKLLLPKLFPSYALALALSYTFPGFT
jgi:hypothetical protein